MSETSQRKVTGHHVVLPPPNNLPARKGNSRETSTRLRSARCAQNQSSQR